MKLEVKTRRANVTPDVQRYIEKRLRSVERYLPTIRRIEVEVDREDTRSAQQRTVVQVTLDVNGTLIRAEERAADVFSAVDAARDVLRRQVRRFKGKVYFERRRRRAQARSKAVIAAPAESAPEGLIVRSKSFAMKPMSAEEALEQMELLGHDFFFFYNFETRQFNVLYRRKAGGYGLIEPSLSA
jgi:putative sigma-54 modulation protein